MSRILALDWDRREARYVLANANGTKVSVRAAASVPLVDVVEGGGEPHPDLANSLRAALSREKVGRVVTLVGVDRGSIELLQLTVPPARDEELPELVFNQAMRDSPTITEDSSIDFFALGDNPAKPRRVTAAALAPERLARITETCRVVGVKPQRMLLRPFASASLFARTASPLDEPCLLVNLVADEVDLTVLDEGKVLFSRTVRLPHSSDEQQTDQRVLAEIHRSLAVALPSQLDDTPVGRVYVFGGPGEHQELIERIGEELSLAAEAFDPFEAVDATSAAVPGHGGRFASLLGMVLDEAHGSHAVDFLHPREKPKPLDRRRVAVLAAAVVTGLAVVVGYYVSGALADVDARNRQLGRRLGELNALLNQNANDFQVFQAVRDWQSGGVLWLEELRELSLALPDGEDMVILRMSLSPARSGAGGVIGLQGVVRDSSTVVVMEQGLRDGAHQIRSPSVYQRAKDASYPWAFDATVFAAGRTKSQYTRHLPDPAP
ncbi:MAG: hypothetical protein JXB62_23350 [Pirellulales bacterium]|nr:hypothetical protein [Pirellulales bacterium]